MRFNIENTKVHVNTRREYSEANKPVLHQNSLKYVYISGERKHPVG